MSESWSEQITAMWCMLPRFMTACYLLHTVTLQPLARDNRDNCDDLHDTSVGCHGCLYHGRPSAMLWAKRTNSASACGCGFEGMGSVIPIKVAREYTFPESGNAYDTGESCPDKVLIPKQWKTQQNLFLQTLRGCIRWGWLYTVRQMKRLAMDSNRNSRFTFTQQI